MFTLSFWKDAVERLVKTFCQVLGTVLIADGTNLLNTHWSVKFAVAGMAAVISFLMSIASVNIGTTGTASMSNAVVPNPVDAEVPKPLGDQ